MTWDGGGEDERPSDAVRAMDAINERMQDLGWSQTDLVKRSGVSATTIRWLQDGIQRSYRSVTLSRVSLALGWRGGALESILNGGEVPEFETDSPSAVTTDPVVVTDADTAVDHHEASLVKEPAVLTEKFARLTLSQRDVIERLVDEMLGPDES